MKTKTKIYGAYPKDENRFKGEYLIILKDKIIAHSRDCKKVLPFLQNYSPKAFITKIPEIGWEEAMVL